MIEKIVLCLLKSSEQGSYRRTEQGYIFEFGERDKSVALVSEAAIEFRIKTIKWIPGSYEPIEGEELYKKIDFCQLENLVAYEIEKMFIEIINKIDR
jgi:hypothetical protein